MSCNGGGMVEDYMLETLVAQSLGISGTGINGFIAAARPGKETG